MAAPTNAVWSMSVLSGDPPLPVATIFILPSPSGIAIAENEIFMSMTITPGETGSSAGVTYEVAKDDASFTFYVDGKAYAQPLFPKTSRTSFSSAISASEQVGSTTTATQTGVDTSSASVYTSTTNTPLPYQPTLPEKKVVSTGVIAGIVVGVLVLLAVILGVVLLLLRRKKKQRAAEGIPPGGRGGGESDKILIELEEAKYNPHDYRPQYTELPGNSQVQELDPASGEVTTFRANEMSGGNGQADELHDGQHTLPSHISESSFPPADASASASAPAPSPFVEARKKVEINWLESEEAKLRQRREQLIMQNGGGES